MPLRCHVEVMNADWVSGWAYDPDSPIERLDVEVRRSAAVLGQARAEQPRPDLAEVGFGDGQCGFRFRHEPALPGERLSVHFINRASNETTDIVVEVAECDDVVVFPPDQVRRLQPRGLVLSQLSGRVVFGRESWFEPPVVVHSSLTGTAQIGSFTGVFGGTMLDATIGRYCSIAPNVSIGPREHPTDWLTTSVMAENGTVHDWDLFARPGERDRIKQAHNPFAGNFKHTAIGNDVWIGSNVLILRGISIGDGAIIAGGSVVTRDVPPYSVVAGVPARVKRLRFDERTVERLLALRWWQYCLYDFLDLPMSQMPLMLDELEDRVRSGRLLPWTPEKLTPASIRRLLATAKE